MTPLEFSGEISMSKDAVISPPAPQTILKEGDPFCKDDSETFKRLKKLKNFKNYLVDTHIVDVFVELLLKLKERDTPLEHPDRFFVDYFGDYRDPILDKIEELRAKANTLKEENKSLETMHNDLIDEVEKMGRYNMQLKVWRSLARGAPTITSMQIYQRLTDRKKPRVLLKGVTFVQETFMRFVADYLSDGIARQLISILHRVGEAGDATTAFFLKDDGENALINAVVTAINMFNSKESADTKALS